MSIKIKDVNYIYAESTAYEIHALKDINLEIPDGQFIGLIGHTGSGKSTLVQHLNGLIKATSGRKRHLRRKFLHERIAEQGGIGLSVSGTSAL